MHIEGTVTAVSGATGFYLQQGSQGVFVESEQGTVVSVGMPVQVVGYLKAGAYSPMLVNASTHLAAAQAALVAPVVSAKALLSVMDGYVYAPYDSLLIQLQGKLLETVRSADEELLLLQSDGAVIPAKLPLLPGQQQPPLRLGSIVALTGISSTVTNEAHEAHGTTLLLRSANDIRVLHAAPIWNDEHALWVIGALSVVLMAMTLWVVFMRRQAHLYDLVIRDPLTSLYNRRGFLLMAERTWNQALRNNQGMLLFYIDLDRFKQINDTLGHKQGDLVLQATAAILRECFRKTDIIGRLGGDEFAVTALDTPDLGEDVMHQRLRQSMRAIHAKHGKGFDVGCSIGVLACGTKHSSSTIEELLADADALMYQEKRLRHAPSEQERDSSRLGVLLPTPLSA